MKTFKLVSRVRRELDLDGSFEEIAKEDILEIKRLGILEILLGSKDEKGEPLETEERVYLYEDEDTNLGITIRVMREDEKEVHYRTEISVNPKKFPGLLLVDNKETEVEEDKSNYCLLTIYRDDPEKERVVRVDTGSSIESILYGIDFREKVPKFNGRGIKEALWHTDISFQREVLDLYELVLAPILEPKKTAAERLIEINEIGEISYRTLKGGIKQESRGGYLKALRYGKNLAINISKGENSDEEKAEARYLTARMQVYLSILEGNLNNDGIKRFINYQLGLAEKLSRSKPYKENMRREIEDLKKELNK